MAVADAFFLAPTDDELGAIRQEGLEGDYTIHQPVFQDRFGKFVERDGPNRRRRPLQADEAFQLGEAFLRRPVEPDAD